MSLQFMETAEKCKIRTRRAVRKLLFGSARLGAMQTVTRIIYEPTLD
jgi:hypothetical protein